MTDKIKAVAQMIVDIYKFAPGGGLVHIVTDDGNVEDENLKWCLDVAIPENHFAFTTEQVELQRQFLLAMQKLTEDERYAAVDLAWKLM